MDNELNYRSFYVEQAKQYLLLIHFINWCTQAVRSCIFMGNHSFVNAFFLVGDKHMFYYIDAKINFNAIEYVFIQTFS